MSEREYKRVSVESKVKALKRHLLEGAVVSQVCDELGVAPSLFYRWQTQLFENAHESFSGKGTGKEGKVYEEKVKSLEFLIRQREEALAELMSEHIALKKRSNGVV